MSTLLHRPFWFLRHGQTDWNVQFLAQGRTEVALNAHGMEQAHQAAAQLCGKGIVTIVSSPLLRARVTAEIAAEKLGLPVAFDDELVEASFGAYEGLVMGDWFQHWVDGDFTPPHAESFLELRARVVRAVNRCLTMPAPVLVVAHGAVMRALRAEMRMVANVRTPNAQPMQCLPPADEAGEWQINTAI